MIVVATVGDIADLDVLVNSAYRGESSKKGWTTEADLLGGLRTNPDALLALMKDPQAEILKYVEDDQLLGCVYLKKKHNHLYLGMLTVSPVLQGKGIGKQLLAAAEEAAIRKQCDAITMTVIYSRTELIDWYKRHGYVDTGRTEPFPTDPEFGDPKQPLYFIVLEKPIQRIASN